MLDNNSYRFYDLKNDPFEKNNLMNGNLSIELENILDKLIIEASNFRKK